MDEVKRLLMIFLDGGGALLMTNHRKSLIMSFMVGVA